MSYWYLRPIEWVDDRVDDWVDDWVDDCVDESSASIEISHNRDLELWSLDD